MHFFYRVSERGLIEGSGMTLHRDDQVKTEDLLFLPSQLWGRLWIFLMGYLITVMGRFYEQTQE